MASTRGSLTAAAALERAEALAGEGRTLEAVDLLHAVNREAGDDALERRLAVLRNAAFAELGGASAHPEWPVPVAHEVPESVAVPDVAPGELSARAVREGIAARGCVRIPGLLSPERVDAFVADINRVLEERETSKAKPFQVSSSWFAGLPLPPEEAASLGRNWIAGAGGVLACDSPKVLDRLFATYAEVGLRDLIADYLGERPVLSANKCTLRLVSPDSNADWHQDGAFLGRGIRALNVWIALSPCGVDAPGMDLLPRRFETLAETGTGGAIFDWAVGPAVVERLAAEAPVVRPEFEAGDCLLFDDLFLHRTAVEPTMTRPRYAIESWFFGATGYPPGQVPLVW